MGMQFFYLQQAYEITKMLLNNVICMEAIGQVIGVIQRQVELIIWILMILKEE